MDDIVVVGAGQAGASLVAKLRGLGFEGKITMIGAEPSLPYQRPPLSKAYLLGDMTEERLYLRPASFYDDQNIEMRLGAPVTAIGRDAKTVTVGDDVIPYGQLAITTGSSPLRLPAQIGGDLDGVYTVRTLADVDAMAPEFVEGKRVLIVGGGYIGLEAAAVAAKRGLNVTLVEMSDRILQRVASRETSDFFRELHGLHGVHIIEGVGLSRLLGGKRVSAAMFSDGTDDTFDFVIVGVGVRPGSELAETAGLDIDNGTAVNAQGQTSDPNIWAAGDCASFPLGDTRVRLESVPHAIEQAELVAENMLGAGKTYVPRVWFWSDQYDVKLQIAGLNTGYDRVVVRDGGKARSHWYYRDGTLIAVDAMNDPRGYMIGKRMIEAGKTPDPEIVADPTSDLKSLL